MEVDVRFVKHVQGLLACTRQEFDSYETFWCIHLSDGNLKDLIPNGSSIAVPFQEKLHFVKAAVQARLEESGIQLDAIKRGISKVIPSSLLNLVTSKELETWVCGRNVVDVKLLRRHTVYGGSRAEGFSENSPIIKLFWQFLESLREEEK